MYKKLIAVSSVLIGIFIGGCIGSQSAENQISSAKGDTQNPPVQWAFTQAGQHPEKELEKVIDSSQNTLDIAIYSLTEKGIVKSILDAKKRGVKIRMITDQTEAKNQFQASQLQLLRSAGILIKENTHAGLMHMKVSIVDSSLVTTGSFNYTTAASTKNDEVFVVIRDPGMAKEWSKEFQAMWDDQTNFTNF